MSKGMNELKPDCFVGRQQQALEVVDVAAATFPALISVFLGGGARLAEERKAD